jgi:magnesium-transporting ATPase (P-type)
LVVQNVCQNKETVIENLQAVNHLCLMCGDGANDVGALKADNVGIALLSGFGDVNVDKGEEDSNKKNGALPGKGGETAMISTQEILALTPKSTALRRSPTWSSSGGRRARRQPS